MGGTLTSSLLARRIDISTSGNGVENVDEAVDFVGTLLGPEGAGSSAPQWTDHAPNCAMEIATSGEIVIGTARTLRITQWTRASLNLCGQVNKGTRWMPWHQEPKKDVGGCDKPRGAANRALIRGFPNGETRQETCPVTHA
jgi:hypothetical protein